MNYEENLLKSKEIELPEKIVRGALILSLLISSTVAMFLFLFNPVSLVSWFLFIIQLIALISMFYFITVWTIPKNQEELTI
jgi:hypothetical protein